MRTYAKMIIVVLIVFLLFIPISNGLIYDPMPPITELFFDEEIGYVTLIAVDYPIYHSSGVNATYYKLDGGEQQTYTEPFFTGEGLHTVEYWSVDNVGSIENMKVTTFTYDGSPPIVEFTYPEPGFYFWGNKMLSFNDTIFCIGKVPITVDAYDNISGISRVFFSIGKDTGYDSSKPYEYTFKDTNFGDLTIMAYAEDNVGRISEIIEMNITCYSLGLL